MCYSPGVQFSQPSPAPFRLTYVCRWCGITVARYFDVPSREPLTLSVCAKPECREQASAAYKAGIGARA